MVLRVEVDENNIPYIQMGKHLMRLDLEDLDEVYKERSRIELNDTPENVETALREFRQCIEDEPGLQVPLDDEDFMMKFLRPFKFNAQNAFKMLKRYYKFKLKYPKYGLKVTPNDVKHVFDNEVFVLLPTRTPDGARLMLMNIGKKWNPKDVTIQDLFKALTVTVEVAMLEPKTQVAGVHCILNLDGLSLRQISQLSPFIAKIIIDWVQECAPIRLKGIHVINQSIFFDMAYAIFKPLMGERLKRKLQFHGSDKTNLCKQLSAEALPASIGGSDPILDYPGHLFSEMLFYYEDLFEKFSSYQYLPEKV